MKEGNERFLSNLSLDRNFQQRLKEIAEKQLPFATILSCSDSRISPELIFDQALGDIYSIRLAGNTACKNAIGSMEYSCAGMGSKLLVVMGHTNCDAVKGACDDISFGHMNEMFELIRFSILRETETPPPERNSKNRRFVKKVAELNVYRNIEVILESSSIIRELIENGEISLVGAMYCVETGKVTFLEGKNRGILDSFFSYQVKNGAYTSIF